MAFALLAPALLGELAPKLGVQIITEVYLICPLLAALGAAVASLATAEATALASSAVGLGARRFASSGTVVRSTHRLRLRTSHSHSPHLPPQVGRTWLSATEQIGRTSDRATQKWQSFSSGVLLAPALAVLTPGPLSFKAIVAAAAAAAQCAYYLAKAEFALAVAVDAVAVKSRQAAVSDTYANQGARAGAILPFTSATASLCAAVTVAVVEVLPLLPNLVAQSATAVVFPLFGNPASSSHFFSKH